MSNNGSIVIIIYKRNDHIIIEDNNNLEIIIHLYQREIERSSCENINENFTRAEK